MCGRYSLFTPPSQLEERFEATFSESFGATYNAAPGQSLPVIRSESPDQIDLLKWGLVPSWADDANDGHINARAETVAEKPSFRSAYERRRCLVLADGFYEWTGERGSRQPYRVAFEDDRPFAMAGIWERWEGEVAQTGLDAFGESDPGPERRVVETFAILTTEPNDLIADLHDRMAVILPPEGERRWLDDEDPQDLLAPIPDDDLRAYPVSRRVNDPANDSPDLIEAVE